MIFNKKYKWMLLIVLAVFALHHGAFGQNLTTETKTSRELSLSDSISPVAAIGDTLQYLPPDSTTGNTAPNQIQNIDLPAALKAGQLQNIRKIYQFELEIYNEIIHHQKKINVT